MKITVITSADGKVLGTAREYWPEYGEGSVAHLKAMPGQTAHELELPREFEHVASPEALHAALEKHLRSVHHKG